jgi:hypothetical protein
VRERLAAKSITLELSEKSVDFLVLKGYNSSLGARPLRRTVERYIEDCMAEELLRGVLTEGVIVVGVAENGESLTFKMQGELPLVTVIKKVTRKKKTPAKRAAPKVAKSKTSTKKRASSSKKSDEKK